MERKFTDDEIVKAMWCCINDKCIECPLSNQPKVHGCMKLTQNALDLINRQQAEIEEKSNRLREVLPIVAELKTEAIKEFAERLCDGRVSNDPVVIAADALLKELTEDKP